MSIKINNFFKKFRNELLVLHLQDTRNILHHLCATSFTCSAAHSKCEVPVYETSNKLPHILYIKNSDAIFTRRIHYVYYYYYFYYYIRNSVGAFGRLEPVEVLPRQIVNLPRPSREKQTGPLWGRAGPSSLYACKSWPSLDSRLCAL